MKTLFLLAFSMVFALTAFAADQVESISVRRDNEAYLILLKSKGNLEYTASFLADPPRVILDVYGAESPFTGKVLEPSLNPYIYRILTGEKLSPGKKIFRIVIELKAALAYSVSPTSEGLVLRLTEKKPEPPPAPAAQPTEKKLDLPANPDSQTKQNKPQPAAQTSQKKSNPPPNPALPTIQKKPDPAVINPAPRNTPSMASAIPTGPQFQLSIGPEDLLEITVFELPQFNVISRVSGDGTVTMPLIGSVKIAGLSKQEAEQKIARELETKYVNDANVSISVKEYKSKQIAVLGAVKMPGPYYILSNRTLLQVITDAGGLTPDAGSKCFVFRQGVNKVEVDLGELMVAGNQKWNVPIYPGDVINIPPAAKASVYVLGHVKNPGPIEIGYGTPLTLLTAIAKAGGLNPEAKSQIQLRRKATNGEVLLIKVNLKDVMKGKEPDLELQADDVINVPESFF